MRREGLALMMGLIYLTGWAQVRTQLADDFSSKVFSLNDWKGDTSHFRFISSSAIPPTQQPSIQLYQSGAGNTLIYGIGKAATMMEWHGWYKLSFNPSASNFARHYLTTGQGFPLNTDQSIFVGIGMVNDRVGIYQHQGSEIVTLLTDTVHLFNQSTNQLRFKVSLKNHWWYLEVDPTGDQSLQKVDSFFYASPFDSAVAGIYCQYTSSNSTKFYVDDIFCGPMNIDTIPPHVLSGMVRHQQEIELTFSEPLHNEVFSNSGTFVLSQQTHPILSYPVYGDPSKIRLIFDDPFPEDCVNNLFLNNLYDPSGNPMVDTSLQFYWHRARRNEILIHEIMADPSPPAKLPESEYIELFNPTPYPISLCDWILWIDNVRIPLPFCTIPGGEYLLLTNGKDTTIWSAYSRVIGLDKFTLRNDGACLALEDHQNKIIHAVCYQSDWHSTTYQAGGGYSLELKDPENPCDPYQTWITSSDISGGTPGRKNSYPYAYPDLRNPYTLRVSVINPLTIRLEFSEPIDTSKAMTSLFCIEGMTAPFSLAHLYQPLYHQVDLHLQNPLQPDTVYLLVQKDTLKDCAGHYTVSCRIPFGIPSIPDSSDIIFHEIMFRPATTGTEYIELFNQSLKIIDLSTLLLAKIDTIHWTIIDLYPVSEKPALIFPGELPVITQEVQKLLSQHPLALAAYVFQSQGMPSLPDQGTVYALVTHENSIVDVMSYSPDDHAPILSDDKGIALERLSAGLPGTASANWFSASEASGWGTPTRPNSQWMRPWNQNDMVAIHPRFFSPSGKTDNFFTSIHLKGTTQGTMGTIFISDETGQAIKNLVTETLITDSDVIIWDGTDASGSICAGGIYIVHIQLYHPEHGRKRYRIPILLL